MFSGGTKREFSLPLPLAHYLTPLTLLGRPFTILYGISPAFTTRACFIQVSRVWS